MNLRNRGNALIVVMVSLAVLLLLVVAAIRFTGTSRDSAQAKNKGDQLQSCAEVARRYLLTQLPVNPFSPTSGELSPTPTLTFERVLPDNAVTAERSRAMSGHYNQTSPSATIVGISALSVGSSRKQIRDIANNLGPATLGGQNYRVVVKCIEPNTTRESELEFAFRYGI